MELLHDMKFYENFDDINHLILLIKWNHNVLKRNLNPLDSADRKEINDYNNDEK